MRMGIDLGGTKIEAAALDDDGVIRGRRRVPTPGDYAGILGTLAELRATLEVDLGAPVRTVGVGSPGLRSPRTGRMQNAENTALQDQPFAADLARTLGRPARLANDALCFAISEAADGAGAGARVVFGAIVGTGTGGGIVVDGRPLGGADSLGCEWGHNPLPWASPAELATPCPCGRAGCIEAFLAGPALARDHATETGEALTAEAIATRAAAGDPAATATLARYVERMARALAAVINLLDPDVIVLGGGVSAVEMLYREVPARWAPWIAAAPARTRLVRNQHGDASGVRGAAWLWP